MNKARMALLTACCLVGIMLAGCSDSTSGKQAGEAEQAAMAFTQGKALSASFSDPRFADMKGVAEFMEAGGKLGHLWMEGFFEVGDPLTASGGPKPGTTQKRSSKKSR